MSTSSAERITEITNKDIICGRNRVAFKHPGNQYYRNLVSLNKKIYATRRKHEKLAISKNIVATIREAGGRFLEREDGKTSSSLNDKDDDGHPVIYRDLGDKKAIEKTSQALREGQPKLLRRLEQKQQVQNALSRQATSHFLHQATSMGNVTTSVSAPGFQYNPYAWQSALTRTSTLPPIALLPHLLYQCEKDLLLLSLLRRANGH